MTETLNTSSYRYADATLNHSHGYLLPALRAELSRLACKKRLFDLGCGNGSVANVLTQSGWDVTGVDPSVDGIRQAKEKFPRLRLELGSAYDDLQSQYGAFPVVLSLEVVEHVYAPRDYARTVFDLLSGGLPSFRRLPTDT